MCNDDNVVHAQLHHGTVHRFPSILFHFNVGMQSIFSFLLFNFVHLNNWKFDVQYMEADLICSRSLCRICVMTSRLVCVSRPSLFEHFVLFGRFKTVRPSNTVAHIFSVAFRAWLQWRWTCTWYVWVVCSWWIFSYFAANGFRIHNRISG